MTTQTLKAAKRNLGSPDTVREFPRGRLEIVRVEDRCLARLTLQPGWKWSQNVRPIAGTGLCQSAHVQYVLSGRLHVHQDDGTELELSAGDFALIPPGHDAWVVGDEPFVAVDFEGMTDYARDADEEITDLPTDMD